MKRRYYTPSKYGKFIGIAIVCVVALLTIAYSAFSSDLGINGISATVRVQKDVRISSISLAGSSGNATSYWEDYNVNSISSGIKLPNSDSTVTYNVKVTNIGNVSAMISDIVGLPSNLTYTLNNYDLNDMLCDDNDSTMCKLGSTTTISITIGYANGGYVSGNDEYIIQMNFDFDYMIDAIAKIGDKYYDTLQEAVDDVPTDNTQTTILLLNNTSEIISVVQNQNIIFDLNDKDLSNVDNNPVISNRGTIEISNGNIFSDASANGAVNVESTGVLIMNSGSIVVTGGRQAIYNNGGRVTIGGTTYLTSSTSKRATVQNQANSIMTINGGTIVSTGSNGLQNNGTLTVGVNDGDANYNSPIIRGITYGINNATAFDYYGGTIQGKSGALSQPTRIGLTEPGLNAVSTQEVINDQVYYTMFLGIAKVITFNPNGGTVSERTRNGAVGHKIGVLPVPVWSGYQFDGWYTAATGGDMITEDTLVTDTATYFAHWTKLHDVAQIDDTIYDTIQEAINAVPNNKQTTIKLLKDHKEAVTISNKKNIVFDLDGVTWSNNGNSAVIENSGTIQIVNGTITSNADTAAINALAGRIVMSGGNIIATGTRQTIYITGGVVEISGSAYLSSQTYGTPTNTSMERGTIQCLSGGRLVITGGTVVGVKQQAVSNEGILTIGTKDGNISTSTPVLMGKIYGVKSTGTFNFYDGIIKGVSAAINGTVSDVETGSQVTNGTETISGETYITAYLS